jgi:hypothetical protein
MKGVERARYAAEAARRRYLAVDPTNRLVAETLEADWNHKLREVVDAEDDYERSANAAATVLDQEHRNRVRALAEDLPALWHDPDTPMRERKRLIRLLVTDVTLIRGDEHITAHVRLTGGAMHSLEVPLPLRAWEAHTTPAATIATIDELLADHTYNEAVGILNERGLTGGWGKPFSVPSLTQLCRLRGIPSLRDRLLATGMLTAEQMATQLGVTAQTIKSWQRRGAITGRRVDGRREHLYHPGQSRPTYRRRNRWQRDQVRVTPVSHDAETRFAEESTTGTSRRGAV